METWIADQQNAEEWHEVILDTTSYTATAIAALLAKYGFETTNQTVYRYRAKHATR